MLRSSTPLGSRSTTPPQYLTYLENEVELPPSMGQNGKDLAKRSNAELIDMIRLSNAFIFEHVLTDEGNVRFGFAVGGHADLRLEQDLNAERMNME